MAILKDMTDKEALPGSFNLHTFIFFPGFSLSAKIPQQRAGRSAQSRVGRRRRRLSPGRGQDFVESLTVIPK